MGRKKIEVTDEIFEARKHKIPRYPTPQMKKVTVREITSCLGKVSEYTEVHQENPKEFLMRDRMQTLRDLKLIIVQTHLVSRIIFGEVISLSISALSEEISFFDETEIENLMETHPFYEPDDTDEWEPSHEQHVWVNYAPASIHLFEIGNSLKQRFAFADEVPQLMEQFFEEAVIPYKRKSIQMGFDVIDKLEILVDDLCRRRFRNDQISEDRFKDYVSEKVNEGLTPRPEIPPNGSAILLTD